MAWGKLGSTTLTEASDTLDIATIEAKKFLTILANFLDTGGQVNTQLKPNSDDGSDYARRFSTNGASDTTQVDRDDGLNWVQTVVNEGLGISYSIDISDEEKLFIMPSVANTATGAGNAPDRKEFVGKWVNTNDSITQVEHTNGDTGSYASDSNVSVLGTD